MNRQVSRLTLGLAIAAMPLFTMGCGAGSSSFNNNPPPAPQNGSVNLMMSDASTEDWATIGVKVLSISLTPQGGGSPVTVYTAPSPAPFVNLVQLDQLSEILGNVTVATGTYTSATLTISANPGDVLLTAAADPEASFVGTAAATIPSSQIQIMGATGNAGSLTVPVNVNFVSPLVVTANQSNALDLEFDLSHPAFLVAHVPTSGSTIWAVNFNGPVRHHPIWDITRLILRHIYGNVTSVSQDNTSITVTRDFPVEPVAATETAVPTAQSLNILADSTNGTLYYDVDAKTVATIMNFSSIASTIDGKFVRVAARYQPNGTLVAVRIWASTSFNRLWISPEGHVLHVNTTSDVITVEDELGIGVPLTVNANTQFFFRTPWKAVADSTPIGTGTAFLSNLKRGFKVHASVVDPLAVPLVAQTIDIEIARFDGSISGANLTGFTYTRTFNTASDNYTVTLLYISSTTPNGSDPLTGSPIEGYKWWNFAFPTLVTSGPGAPSAFESATNGSVNFGGSVGLFPAAGESFATWNDPVAASGWALPWTVLLPTTVPLGTAATSFSNNSFTLAETGGTLDVPVNLDATSGSATLVYQVDRTNNIVTITPVDITTTAGQNTLSDNLVTATPVKVYGVPQANGSIKAYVVIYFTGVKPTAVD
ncbi:MAG TPA: DUF4382 domain-containing protein [Methylomirabilota bacterium]|nr:DUF4382 domain-containing protein [Methylomirabilota bacterium]